MGKTTVHVRDAARDLALALVLLTRLPLPGLPDAAFQAQARAAWAFPVAGLAVALPAGVLGWGALSAGLSAMVAAGLLLAAQILLTGAMHEDGLADCADGFWGGWSIARRLEIMADSRIGTFGTLALILSLGLRWAALAALLPLAGIGAVIAAAVLSRAGLPILMIALPPARPGGLSRGFGTPRWPVAALAVALGLGLASAASGPDALAVALSAAMAIGATGWLARIKIGGQTGDVLGAAQQMSEIAALLTLSVLA
ncbi:adenosylcobinamide-GDP ribazoletransferase [Pukyongiella litopenaei]|uniref:Adenosylcobinamide-GDP ribazoletransferase n=1 Tax=Pukyongiella litopenaei TaxID=2605946 RepID=A0A2S0MKK4_9RHOB|nr:adenosylcobinamide-GDP ribazoletransferase [Pukyongiella litopenaei]AVO36418.1 adenosylcobinamide-GDP ribazoletransferase [Pukyongiella litopenaei]